MDIFIFLIKFWKSLQLKCKTLNVFLLTVFLSLSFIFLPEIFPVQASGESWLTGYSYRRQITIDNTKVSDLDLADFANFPVLITKSGLSNILANGADIRFTSADGATQLPREIESYSSGSLIAWVKIPTLTYNADTIIYMYYGKANDTEPAADSAYGSQNVWTNNYAGVWHLKETGSGSVADFKDSTSNGNNSVNTTGQPTYTSSGKIGGGESFSAASSNFISVGANSTLNPAQFTFGFWVDTETTTSNKWNVFAAKENWDAKTGWLIYREITSKDQAIYTRGGYDTPPDTTTTSSPGNGWHHIVGTYNGTVLEFWMDGTSIGQKTATIGNSSSIPLYFGSRHGNDGTGTMDFGTVILDEGQLSSSVRTDGWIVTTFNNQNSPSTFASVGNEGAEPTPTPTLTPTPTNSPTPTPVSQSSNSSATSSNNTPSAPNCQDSKPASAPDLFQTDAGNNNITLYFTPINNISKYYISYSTKSSAEEHGTQVNLGSNGVQNYTINALLSGTTYYFKVRGQNGCMPGDWSNIKSSTTKESPAPINPVENIINVVKESVVPKKELKIVSSNITEKKPTITPTPSKAIENNKGVTLDVKVLSIKNEPVIGATVTIHSKVQSTKTDKNGIARFTNVEPGEHKVLLAYKEYNGEQKLNVDGKNKEQTLTLQVKMNNGFSSPIVIIVIVVMAGIIFVLLYFLFRRKISS